MRGSRPFVAGEPGCRRQVLAVRVGYKGALAGSVARWPLGGIENSCQLWGQEIGQSLQGKAYPEA